MTARPTPLRLLQATAFVSTLDRFAMAPMLVAISRDLDVPLAAVVQAAGVYFFAYGLCQPVWGVVSDRIGRVRTMQVTLVLAAICTIASAFAESSLALAITRGLAGAFFGAAFPATLIYLGDVVPAERRQPDVVRLMAGVAAGTAVASVGAGVLAGAFTWRVAFLITGVAALLLTVALRSLPEPDDSLRPTTLLEPLRAIRRSRATALVLLLAFTEGAVLLGVLTLLPAAIESTGVGSGLAGGVTAVYGVAVFAGSLVVGRLARRWHPSRLIAVGAVAAVAGSGLLALSQEPAPGVVVAVLLGLAWCAMHSTLQTWATEVLPAARATVVSLFAGSLFAGSAAASVAAAGLVDAGRYGVVFGVAAALAVPLGVVGVVGRSRWPRRPVTALGTD